MQPGDAARLRSTSCPLVPFGSVASLCLSAQAIKPGTDIKIRLEMQSTAAADGLEASVGGGPPIDFTKVRPLGSALDSLRLFSLSFRRPSSPLGSRLLFL